MATPVIMPRQGQSVESCILTEWKVNVGDQVAEGDVLAVIETDKASFDLESTASGTVLALFWEADDDVPVLCLVIWKVQHAEPDLPGWSVLRILRFLGPWRVLKSLRSRVSAR